MAKLAREKDAQGATAWTLTLDVQGRVTSRVVVFERVTSWAGPCSNEIAYRCTVHMDDPATVALEGGLDIVTIEGRGAFAIRRVDRAQNGTCQIELYRLPSNERPEYG